MAEWGRKRELKIEQSGLRIWVSVQIVLISFQIYGRLD